MIQALEKTLKNSVKMIQYDKIKQNIVSKCYMILLHIRELFVNSNITIVHGNVLARLLHIY